VKRLVGVLLAVAAVALAACSASFLVVNSPQRSDALVVLGGDAADQRYWRAIELLRSGNARDMFVDARADEIIWGRTAAEHTAEFIRESAGDLSGHVHVCAIRANSTRGEADDIRSCLEPLHLHSVLIVTSDYHTRRALSIARHVMPQYQWSIAATTDDQTFGRQWWKRRTWAKTNFLEWQRLAWWEVVERWRS
jgi:uncharacterized SAM-binding protein YcdF (DUF218 family)